MAKTLQAPGPFLALMLEKYKLNPFKLSKDIHLSQSAVRLITIGKTKITVPVAMRLAQYFNTNPEFWLAMQMKWDISEAEKDKDLMKLVKSIARVTKGSAGGNEKPAGKKAAEAKAAPKAAEGKKAAAVKKGASAKAGAKAAVGKKAAAAKAAPGKVTAKKAADTKKAAAGKKAGKAVTAKKTAAAKPATAGKRGRPAAKN